jgi:tetratricopeptide (TPR) repeat protein
MSRKGLQLGCCFAVLMGSGCVWLHDLPYRDQRRAADQAFESQQYVLAAARYEALSDLYPNNDSRQDLIFRQGVSLYSVSSYHEARIVFAEYLDTYPHGQYVADIKDYIRKIDVLMSKSTPAEAVKLAEAKAKDDLDELSKLLAEHPTDWRVLEAIGDAHWQLGNHDLAIEYYYKAQSIASAYEERKLNNGRLILNDSGEPIPVTPALLKSMEIERNPVRVYDLHTYNSRNRLNNLGGDIQFFNLTGSVRNQGKELLRNVEVEVVYRDIGSNILDVDYVAIGTLGPGEVKTFLSRADNYDNLYNIVDYDVTAHWRE